MFKKTEDSEWSRFSRVLGHPKAAGEETPVKEQPPEPVPAAREPAVAAPVPPPAPPRPAAQPYTRAYGAQHEVDEAETVIGVNSSFDGTLRCESNMRVKGAAQGEISCAKSLTIEESAQVNARVTAANAVVAGKLDGSIICDGRLEILATGQVTGELTAGVLIIQEGAFFEGHLKMKDRRPGDGAAGRQVGAAALESAAG